MTQNNNQIKLNTQSCQIAVTGSAVFHGDCLEIMKSIPDCSIDMILCDLPYGTTRCKWDIIIPYNELWEQYNRIRKNDCVVVLFGNEPFSSFLRISNIKNYRYDLIWKKNRPSGAILAKKQPMRNHEKIHIFYNGKFNPIKENRDIPSLKGKKFTPSQYRSHGNKITGHDYKMDELKLQTITRNPTTVLKFDSVDNSKGRLHSTQKPVALLEYLIKTHSNEGDLILDNCAGSGTTAIACLNTKRNYILMEKEKKYFDIINERIDKYKEQKAGEFDFENAY